MNGLRAYIKKMLPHSWEHVLRQEKKLLVYIEYVYNSLPKKYRGKYGWLYGRRHVRVMFEGRTPIYLTFKVQNSTEGILYWKSIENKIKDYEYLCK